MAAFLVMRRYFCQQTKLFARTNTLTIPAITPAQGETKKFYKVVVDFAGSSAQN